MTIGTAKCNSQIPFLSTWPKALLSRSLPSILHTTSLAPTAVIQLRKDPSVDHVARRIDITISVTVRLKGFAGLGDEDREKGLLDKTYESDLMIYF